MNKEVKKYLEEIKKERTAKLLGLILDIGYFDLMLSILSKEEDLRKELEEEEKKKIINKDTGLPAIDKRDLEKVQNLNKSINRITTIKQQKKQFEQLYDDITEYIKFIDTVPEDVVQKLESARLLDKS